MNFTFYIKSCTQLCPPMKNDPFKSVSYLLPKLGNQLTKMDVFLENKVFFKYITFFKKFKSWSPSKKKKLDTIGWFLTSKNAFESTKVAFLVSFDKRHGSDLKGSFSIGGQSCVQDLMWNLKRTLVDRVWRISKLLQIQ